MKGLINPEELQSLPSMASWLSYVETTGRILREKYSNLKDAPLSSAAVYAKARLRRQGEAHDTQA